MGFTFISVTGDAGAPNLGAEEALGGACHARVVPALAYNLGERVARNIACNTCMVST